MPLRSAAVVLLILVLLGACGGDGPTRPASVSSIFVAPDTAYVRLGTTRQLDASPRAADGTVLAGARLAWASTDTAVATVSPAGLVTARGYGTTSVTATADGVTGRAYVRVTGTPGLRIVAGGTGSDTVNATLAQPLVVELRDSQGLPVAGAQLEFVPSPPPQPRCGASAFPGCSVPQIAVNSTFGFGPLSPTDASGRVTVRVGLGYYAGPATLVVSAPTRGVADTARFTILPGAAARLAILPEDTTLYVGGQSVARTTVTDRHGNPRDDTPSLRLVGDAATLEGTTVRAAAFGGARLIATVGPLVDTAYVGVVPRGTIAAFATARDIDGLPALYTLDLDGSNVREVRRSAVGPSFAEMPAAWLGPTRLVHQDNTRQGTRQLHLYDLATGEGRPFLPAGQQMPLELLSSASPDGAWVYFAGGTFDSHGMYRARADGSGRERLSPPFEYGRQWGAHPSPDGTRIAYVSSGIDDLEVMDLATRQVRPLGIRGTSPRWSPDGTRIAYVSQMGTPDSPHGQLRLVSPDGSNDRPAAPDMPLESGAHLIGTIDWSRDGRYLIGSRWDGRLAIVEVATGRHAILTYPILGGRPLRAPAWKP